MAISLGDAVVTFRADLTDLNKSIGNATRDMKKNFGNILGVAGQVGTAITGASTAAVGGLGAIVLATANAGDEILDLAKRTGFSTEEVSRWAFALKQSGGDITTLQAAVKSMATFIDDARQGAKGATDTLARLGFTIQDFAGLTPEQIFSKLALAIAEIKDPIERAAIGNDVFKKAAQGLLPVLSEGRQGIQAMFDEVERAGGVFTQAEAAMGDEFNDSIGTLRASFSGIAKEISTALMPALIGVIDFFRNIVVAVKDWIAQHPVLTGWIVKIVALLGGLGLVIGPLLMALPGLAIAFTGISTALAGLTAPVATVAAAIGFGLVAAFFALREVITNARQWITAHWTQIVAVFRTGADIVVNLGRVLWQQLRIVFNLITSILAGFGLGVGKTWDSVTGDTSTGSETFLDTVQRLLEDVKAWTARMAETWTTFADNLATVWKRISEVVATGVDNTIGPIARLMNFMIEAANSITGSSYDIGDALSLLAGIFGAGISQAVDPLGFGRIPQFASGGKMRSSGLAIVGEQGPELVHLPAGARVYSNSESQRMMGGGGMTVQGPLVGNIQISGVNDPRAIAEQVGAMLERAIQNKLAKRGLRLQHA